MRKQTQYRAVLLALLCSLTMLAASGSSRNQFGNSSVNEMQAPTEEGVVYVCACLKTKSCFCMTEAKMEGPCACGTQGGPPMKAVKSDSAWAKENRDALTK